MSLSQTAECIGMVALSLAAEFALRVALLLAPPENVDEYFRRTPNIDARSKERVMREVIDSHNIDFMLKLADDDSVAQTRLAIVLGADPCLARRNPRFVTIGHFRAVYEAGVFRDDHLRREYQDRLLIRTVEMEHVGMCEELIRLIGSPVDYKFNGEDQTLWEYAVRASGAATLCAVAMQAFPMAEFPRFNPMPDAWYDGKSTEQMCTSRDRKLLADIAIGLAELDLPVNLIVQFFEVHLADCHNAVPLVVQWEIGKLCKHFRRMSLRRSARLQLQRTRPRETL